MLDAGTLAQIAGVAVAGGAGFGAGAVAVKRLVPLLAGPHAAAGSVRASKSPRPDASSPERRASGGRKTRWGNARKSSITGLERSGIIRYHNGYGRAWEATPISSRLSHDAVLDNAVNRVGRLLISLNTPGTVLQIRLSKGPDPGRAISEHISARDKHADQLARDLSSRQLETHIRASAAGSYQQSRLSLWLRTPSQTPGFAGRYLGRKRDALKDEAEAREYALSTIATVERMFPLKLRRLDGNETWRALYKGHNKGSKSVPDYSRTSAVSPAQLLCGTDLTSTEDRMLVDGNTTVAVVSLLVAPHPRLKASMQRLLESPDFAFEHTVIVEYEVIDQRSAKNRLDRRINQLSNSANWKLTGNKELTPEARKILEQLKHVRDDVADKVDKLVATRFYAVVHGPEVSDVSNKEQMEAARRVLNQRCELLINALNEEAGAEAIRESQASLEYIYPYSVVGELGPSQTGREIIEATQTVAALSTIEAPFAGMPNSPTLLATNTGRLIGIDLRNRNFIPSPNGLIIGSSGSGKSVLLSQFILDELNFYDETTVHCIDYGESQDPLGQALNANRIRFKTRDGEALPINGLDYDGLADGVMPDDTQMELAIGDLMHLSHASDDTAHNIFHKILTEVYKDATARNRPGTPKSEPTLSHVLDKLKTMGPGLPSTGQRDRAGDLLLALEQYRRHKWLDQPTHESFRNNTSRFTIWELASLNGLQQAVKDAMAYRLTALVGTTGGKRNKSGKFTPVLICIDEGHEIRKHFPIVFRALETIARTGRKENVFQLIATQAWSDLKDCPSIIKNSSLKLIGRQNEHDPDIAKDCGLSLNAEASISSIECAVGHYAQFVMIVGSGPGMIVEKIQHELAPMLLWIVTTDSNERDARTEISTARPDWSVSEVAYYLSLNYPRGLTAVGVKRVNEKVLGAVLPKAA